MSEAEIISAITAVLTEVQQIGGHDVQTVTAATTPIGQLEGFDSLVGIEATVLIEDKLGVKLDELKSDSIFVSRDKHALTVKQAALRILPFLNRSKS